MTDNQVDSDGNSPKFYAGDRVIVGPNNMKATVIRQVLHYDYPESFWGNLELCYDDGVEGTCNCWQVMRIEE
jgi:hypothetical protein